MSYLMVFVEEDILCHWIVICPLCSLTLDEFKYLKEFYGIENLRLSYIHDYEISPFDLGENLC